MFQTEFCGSGPHCKLLISWDSENYQNITFDSDIFKDEDVFYKLNDLYQNLSKFSTEFVECMKSVHGPNLEQLQNHLHENNPSVTFKIENFNKESYSDELFLLKQQVEKLKQENEQLVIEHGIEISKLQHDFEQRTNRLILEQEEKLNSVRQELEDKYNDEMSDLRKYFENKCTESLRQFTEESYQCSRDSDSDSYSDIEPDDENYEAIGSTKYTESNIDHATKDLQKILDKDLKNIRKAYIVEVDKLKEELTKKKEDEIRELKLALETKYTAKFEQFQAELDRLANGKILEDSVHYVHSQVKQEYENELERLQNLSDIEFATRIEDDLILKHNEELNKRDEEWRNRVESSLSDYMVDSALKNVIKESQQKSQSCHCSPAKKYKYKEIKQLKQKYKQELDDAKLQYENQIQSVVVKYEQEILKLNEESNTLISQNKELLETNEKRSEEIDSLKRKIHEYLHLLRDLQENESIDKIRDELSKMKAHYEIEVSTLRENKYVLEKALEELQEKMRNVENTRYNIISSLQSELKHLISKEQDGEAVVWPDELRCFYELLRVDETNKKSHEQIDVSAESERDSLDLNNGMYEDDDLDDILQQRETLRKVILTLYSACESFRRYISNLDEERNNTLTNELNRMGVVSKDVSTFDDVINSLNETEKETLKKLHLTANISEMMSLFGDDESLNITVDCNKSFNQSELSCWFEKLKNDAAAILCLTSGKKVEVSDDRLRNVDIQTDVDGRKYEETRQVIQVLQKEISAYEEQYARAQQDIDELTREVARLNNKINSLESLEAYGEGVNAVPERVQYDDATLPQKQLAFSRIEEFCAECDKIKEEARREREDLESQIEAASKKLKSFEQFLERETVERELEREESDRKVKLLQDQLKEKERDLNSLNHYSTELNTLEHQLKELTGDYESTKIRNQTLEGELNAATDKIWTLRERIQELESKLAQKSVLAESASVELKQKRTELERLQREYQEVRQELDSLQDSGTKQLDMLNEQHEISAALIKQLKSQLVEVEKMVTSRTRELENNYVAVSSSNVASSPSEDISVCDRIADRLRLVSPSGSDASSSSPIHVPVDLLVCLNEKLKKLFRAEEAALKRIQDQDMQINKLSLIINELQLEKETVQDKLNEVSSKLGEAKFKLDNWQQRANSAQSEFTAKLTKTVDELESQIVTHQRIISQKDAKLKEFAKRIEQTENFVKSTENELTEKIGKIENVNENLRKQLRESTREIDKLNDLLAGHRQEENLSLSAVVEKLLEEKNDQIHELEEKIVVLKSLADIADKSHSTEIESKGSSRRNNFTETTESYSDYSDRTRHAVAFDETISPRYISISSSVKKPLLATSSSESSGGLQQIHEIGEQIDKPEEHVQKQVTFTDDSIQVNLDDLSWTRAPNRESTKIDMDKVDGASTTEVSEHNVDVLQEEVKSLKSQLEEEKQNHFATLIQLRELNGRWEAEKKQMKDAETAFIGDKATTEKRLKDLEWEHVTCKEQCYKYEQQVLILQKDLDTKKEAVEELKKQLNEMETLRSAVRELEIRGKMEADQLKAKDQRLTELTTLLEAEKNKTRELNENYEKVFKAVVKERVDAQVKCEEFAHNLKNVAKELDAERSKSEKLTRVVENMNKKNDQLDALNNQARNDKDEIDTLKRTIQRLETEIGQAENEIRRLEEEKRADERDSQEKQIVLQSGVISSHNSTLKDLTQKVQKEVDLAALLDENMLQSLEFDSKTESFLEELTKLSPVGDELRQILLKILYGGFQALNVQEKIVLQNAYHAFDDVMPNKMVQLQTTVERLSELVKELQIGVENEKKFNKELSDKNHKLQLEMNRLETVHSYFEERISFLIAKLDEYRNKAVKTEIELTTEKTSRRQVEVSFEHFKRQTQEKHAYEGKKLEETIEQLNITSNENLKLKQESEVLRNRIESLIAELNSVKAITQYHSDSESELSRSLNPLKERLNEMEDKYSRIKHDYEKKKLELRTIKANLHVERTSCKKLESIVKEISGEKHRLEKQLIDKNSRLEDLNWQKQKLEDKLKAAELAEMKRRKMKTTNDVNKKEFECSKELQRKLEKDCQEFQKNITKLVEELTSTKNNCKQVTQEAQRIFLRMLKAESSQRSLVYQKNYLVVTLHEYEQKCDGIVRSITSGMKSLSHYVTDRVSMKQKFKSAVFCVISTHRMQFLSNRRIQNNYVKMKNYFLTHVPEITARNDDCFDVLSVKKLHYRESKKDTQDVEEMALQNLCQQFANLRNKYVVDNERKST